MEKTKAIQLLGGNVSAAARSLGVSWGAVNKWPDKLSRRVSERVLGVVARKYLPPEILRTLEEEAGPAAAPQVQ